jgi:translation initiation factor IF-3
VGGAIKPKGKPDSKTPRINQEIHAPKIRLIDENGNQVGIVSPRDALIRAEEVGLDLVEIAPQGNPPVCRIMDYGKYRYEMSKKEKDARKKQHTVQLKGIRLTPNIDDHDFNFKIQSARKFIESGSKVKVSVIFKGRAITHKELGVQLIERVIQTLEDIAKVDSEAKMEGGRNMVITFVKK